MQSTEDPYRPVPRQPTEQEVRMAESKLRAELLKWVDWGIVVVEEAGDGTVN